MTTLAFAIYTLLLAQPPGVAACSGEADCTALATEIAEVCEFAGRVTHIDPWLLAAIGHVETSYDRTREGWRGRGMFGLNPRGRSYREAVMLCNLSPNEGCLLAEAFQAGAYLNHERRKHRCGSLDGALRSYGNGDCDGVKGDRDRYVRKVRRSLRKLRGKR